MKMPRCARLFQLAGCTLALGVAGCTGWWAVGPDYKEPEIQAADVPLPDAGYPTTNKTETGEFKAAATNEDPRAEIDAESIRAWWTQFNDDVLTNLVETAVSNNLSFLMAQERLVQARWALVGSAAAFLPSVTMDGTYTRSGAHGFTSSRGGSGTAYHGDHWNSGFDASWEIDVFGGTRRAYEAAEAQLDATAYSLADAWVSLTAEIASTYVQLRTVQERLTVARANLKLQSETYDILKSRLDSGIGDELAVKQAKYNVEQTRAGIPTLLASEEKLMNALAILAGEMPGALHETLRDLPERDWLVAPRKLSEIPLDLMRMRPDVKSTERALAAQVAAVGVAKSLLYPKFYINGSLGLESYKWSDLFHRKALVGAIGPSFSWPLFQGGNMVANLRVAESKMNEALLKYELALQTAYSEARNAYAAYTQQYHRYQSLESAVKAAQEAEAISQDLYKNGLKDFNNVL
ncbi:MAG: efflux transporter outer membrane subunit, partial [Kiritimatiellae bacterium]|nr:efflux transporter outer membrane subunit [Kiritimatiellia bacterium]